MESSWTKRLLSLAWVFIATPALAQLPELALPSAATGASTTAQFFAGASADNGLSFGDSFAFDQALDITAEIHVESGHVGTTGNLYIVAQIGEDLLFRDANGAYQPWDLNLATLQATTAGKSLAAIEPLTIVDDVALGPAGVSGTTLLIYFAYDTAAAPGELYYSGAPLSVAVAEEVVTPTDPQSLTLFNSNIHDAIIQSNCIVCHVSGGTASATRLVYVSTSVSNAATVNYNTLLDFMQTESSAANLLISKPQGQLAHGGDVRLTSGSASLNNWIEFVNALESDAQ